MAANQRKAREGCRLSTTGWSDWELAMVPLVDGFEKRGETDRKGFICSNIRNAFPDEAERCGIYEWQARKSGQPDRVVYVGSTCRCSTRSGPLRARILEYCTNGSHKKDLINDALSRGYELWVRVQVVERPYPDGIDDAQDLENAFLDTYNYAWNKRRNGDIRNILP